MLKLREPKYRRQTGLTIVEGVRELRIALDSGAPLHEVFMSPELVDDAVKKSLLEAFACRGISVIEVSSRVYERIAFGERREGVLATAVIPRYTFADLGSAQNPGELAERKLRLLVVVEGVEKPGNLGAIIRSADAAGASGIIAADCRCDPFSPAVIRASLGTALALPLCVTESRAAAEWLRENGFRVIAALVGAETPYWAVDYSERVALVLGAEDKGLSDQWLGSWVEPVTIPMAGRVDSLNVSVAAAILLFEVRRQYELKHGRLQS